ncbi:MAG: MFS transporter [Micavibrio sp.]
MKRSLADHNARLLNLFALCHGGIFVLPVLLPYYRDQVGLGFKELMAGEALFAAVLILSEVPTGWLADHWKRKYCLALAGIIGMFGFFLLSQAETFLATLVAQGSLGVGISLVSGTLSALHYDSLLAEDRIDEYRKQEGRRHALGLMSIGVSSLLGGFLYKAHPELPIVFTMLSEMGMIVFALLMIEPPHFKAVGQRNPFVTMGQTLKYALHGNKEIAEIIFIAAALFSTTKMMMWAQQSYYTALALDERWFGVLMAAGFVLGATASHLGHMLDHRFRNRTVLLGMILSVVVLCIVSAVLHNIYGAVLMLAGSLFWGLGWPRIQDALNQRTDSHHRATVLSTASMMIHLFFIPLSLMLGLVSDRFGIETAILCLAVTPALASIILIRMVFRDRRGP